MTDVWRRLRSGLGLHPGPLTAPIVLYISKIVLLVGFFYT